MKKTIAIILALVLLILTGVALISSLKTKETVTTSQQDILNYFIEIAFGHEYNGGTSNQAVLVKWTKPKVTIKTYGDFNQYLTNCLDQVILDFNDISVTTDLVINKDSGDINLYLVPKDRFLSIEPNYVAGNDGYFWMLWDDTYAITSSTILINSDYPDKDKERCHLIREELTQSMGLAKDSDRYEDSIFYGPWRTTLTYADIDKELIKILYSSDLKPGMTVEEVRAHLE
ncbi:MAG: hypothetical protein ACD_22C00089G0007 [uncultured bacterium]|nr:MAG: hypothetical protein ACD_22C00089G0007 [uncultured bacterium]